MVLSFSKISALETQQGLPGFYKGSWAPRKVKNCRQGSLKVSYIQGKICVFEIHH